MRTVTEEDFRATLRGLLQQSIVAGTARSVTGPGRSGAIAAVYASHMLGIPFVPYGQPGPAPVLVVDTAQQTGATMRKALRRYEAMGLLASGLSVFGEPPRVRFWYEAGA